MPNPRTDQIAFMIFVFTILAVFMTTIVMLSGCSVANEYINKEKSRCKASCECTPCKDNIYDLKGEINE